LVRKIGRKKIDGPKPQGGGRSVGQSAKLQRQQGIRRVLRTAIHMPSGTEYGAENKEERYATIPTISSKRDKF